jgi:predicted transcriptional regulator
MAKQGSSIKLPADVVRRVIRVARKANRNPSDLAAEALHGYLLVCERPEETPTAAELRAIRRGDYVMLDELRTEQVLAPRPRKARAKAS